MRRERERRAGAERRPAERHAGEGQQGRQPAPARPMRREGSEHGKARPAIEARQVEFRPDREPRHDEAARQGVQHGPARAIGDGGEAMAEAAPQQAEPGLVGVVLTTWQSAVFLLNSRLGPFTAASFRIGCSPSRNKAPLLPKLRGYFAEFLNVSSLARLRIFFSSTCVGFGTVAVES